MQTIVSGHGAIQFVLTCITIVLAACSFFIVGISVRRLWRKRMFARRDRRSVELRTLLQNFLVSRNPLLPELYLRRREDRRILHEIIVERLPVADQGERQFLVTLLERSGLIHEELRRLQEGNRWQRARAAALLGQLGSMMAVEPLARALRDPVADVRHAATRSLTALAHPLAAPALVEAARAGTIPRTLLELALQACARTRPELLLPLLEDVGAEPRAIGAAILGELAPLQLEDKFRNLAFDGDAEIRARAARGLGKIGGDKAVSLLIALSADPVWFVRLRAVAAMGELKTLQGIEAILRAIQDDNWLVRAKAGWALGQLTEELPRLIYDVHRTADLYAMDGLVSELERAGIIWRAIENLKPERSPHPSAARRLLTALVSLGRVKTIMFALETFPRLTVRIELLKLIRSSGTPRLVTALSRVAASVTLDRRLRRAMGAVIDRLVERQRQQQPAL